MIIGITGPIASGKSILSKILEDKGFIHYKLSDEVREEAKKRGLSLKRKNLQDLGNEMRVKFGKDYWVRKVLQKIHVGSNYVIDGIRNPGEIAKLKETGNFILIGVNAPIEKRLERIRTRNKDTDPKVLQEIGEVEKRDRGISEPLYGQQVEKCLELADFKIINDGTLNKFKNKINILLKEIIG